MARLVVSAAVAVGVGAFLGPQAGFAAFSATYGLTGFLDPAQKVRGPKLDDLKGTTAAYGTPLPYVKANPRVAGYVGWCSDKQEVANTQEQGGKGGPSSETTTYTYKIDVRYLISANPIEGVRRIWSNGKLIWSAAADADAETIDASAETDAWERMTVYTGAADQMPDPVEEAALGIDNCPAYRGRGSVFIEGLNLGGSGYLPNLTFEIGPGELSPGTTVSCRAEGTAGVFEAEQEGVEITGSGYQQGAISSPNPQISYPIEGLSMAYNTGNCGMTATVSGEYADNGAFAFSSQFFFTEGGSSEMDLFQIRDASEPSNSPFFIARREVSGPNRRWFMEFFGEQATSAWVLPNNVSHPYDDWALFEAEYDGSGTVSLRVGPVTVLTLERAPTGETRTLGSIAWGYGEMGSNSFAWDDFTATVGASAAGNDLTPVPLEDVLTDLCLRSGIPESYVDFSSCSGQLVRALAVTQVTPARQVMEMLGGAYLQEFVEGAGLKTVARGGASALTIPYDDLGASAGDPVEPLPLKRLNDIELPRQFAITYANVLNDHQNGTEYSDRLLGGSTSVATSELPLGLQPQEAKRIADCKLLDAVAGIIQIGPVGITRAYAHLEPSDVVTLTDHEGSTFRARVLKITDDAGLRTLELVLDDASAVSSSAVTDEDYESSSVVRSNATTILEMIDSPIFRDADNDAGAYMAVTKSSADGIWPGAVGYQGLNDAGYAEVARFTDRTFIGTTTTDLAPWDGGHKFDEVNTVTVSGIGTLQSYTRDAILNGTANGYLIGSEVLYARTATLVGTGIYTLSGLLRGRRGTEWAAAEGTDSGSRAVLIQTQGWRRISMSTSQIGVEYDYKGVTLGASLGSVDAEAFTNTAIGLKPFAPVNARASRASNGNIAITWSRRTRLDCGFTGSNGITVPLGEATEAYRVVVYADDTFATVKRTLTATSETVTYTAAQQETDFGSVQDEISVRIYQVSASVGNGYPLEVTLGAANGIDSFTPDSLNTNPKVLLTAGDEFLACRDGTGNASLGFYTYDGDLGYTSKTTQSTTNPYTSGHLSASDPTSKKFVLLMRGTSNASGTRKLFYGTLPGGPTAVVPAFMPANPPVGLWWTGSEFRALLVDGTVYSSATGASWASEGATSGLPTLSSDLIGAYVVKVGSALAMKYGTEVFYCSSTAGLSWSDATGDVATLPTATYSDFFALTGIASNGSRAVLIAVGKKPADSSKWGIVYTSTDGEDWTKEVEQVFVDQPAYYAHGSTGNEGLAVLGTDFLCDLWPVVGGSNENSVIEVHDFGDSTLTFAYKVTGTGGVGGSTLAFAQGNGTTAFDTDTIYRTSNLTSYTAIDWADE